MANPATFYEQVMVRDLFGPWARWLIESANVATGDRVLDLACGTGAVAREALKAVGDQGTVTGLDVSPLMLEVARETVGDHPNVSWVEGSGTDTGLPGDSFDVVLCQQGLQFFPDKAAGLREVVRVLREGGRFRATCWAPASEMRIYEVFDEVVNRHLVPGAFRAPFALGDQEALESLVADAGFSSAAVERESMNLRFNDAPNYVVLALRGAAAVMPEFGDLPPEQADKILGRMRDEILEQLTDLMDGDALVDDTVTNVIYATA